MRDRPSFTAAWVATSRTLGSKLPEGARLVTDPYGASFAGRSIAMLVKHSPSLLTLPTWPFALYMQVRTRAIDDVVRDFAAGGGRQVLLLGAGYDCRAARLATELDGAHVFESRARASTIARQPHCIAAQASCSQLTSATFIVARLA